MSSFPTNTSLVCSDPFPSGYRFCCLLQSFALDMGVRVCLVEAWYLFGVAKIPEVLQVNQPPTKPLQTAAELPGFQLASLLAIFTRVAPNLKATPKPAPFLPVLGPSGPTGQRSPFVGSHGLTVL